MMEEKKKCRIIIAGGRHFQDYDMLRAQVMSVFEKNGVVMEDTEIVSGHATGADQLGERFAQENGLLCTIFPANWSRYGRSAGFRRNVAMVNYAAEAQRPFVIAFWNGESHGTGFTIRKAREKGIPVEIFYHASSKEAKQPSTLNEQPNEVISGQDPI